MSGLLSLLDSDLGKQLIGGLSNQTGVEQDKAAETLGMALPLLMGAMKKNASTPQGADGLLKAMDSPKHDGSILENLSGLFAGGVEEEVLQDGDNILGHIFGGNRPVVENTLSKQSGLDAGMISQILKVAAPIALGMLGRAKRENNISSQGDLNTLLGSMLGGQPSQNRDLITSLLDSDGDGSILDDVSEMVVGAQKSKGGLSGLLGSLFGSNS